MADVILDTLKDFGIVLPFLFLTYLLMEWLETRAGEGSRRFISRAGRFGPVFGGLFGAIPQCGFSAAAAGLYAGRVLTLGTLYAVFLSTSDEMLPILISERTSPLLILKVLGVKVLVGILLGLLTDLVLSLLRRAPETPAPTTEELTENESCSCGCSCGCCDGSTRPTWARVLLSALKHTAKIAAYLFVTVFVLNTVVYFVGEERLASVLSAVPVLPQAVSALVGLIPNCAASVVITELWIKGTLSGGSMLAGLLAGAGVGTLVLWRVNRPLKQTALIIAVLWAMGFAVGTLFDLTGLSSVLF